jgi:SAM-dependent methyltransferase/uncharacterized protein YbaR (Trm112 family)
MRRRHFDELAPVCPYCRSQGRTSALSIGTTRRARGSIILDGALHCTSDVCSAEYPIIDGIPILMADVRAYVTDNLVHLTARDDLSEYVTSMIGDATGPGSAFNTTRQFLSSYAWDHYADLDPQEPPSQPKPGGVVRTLDRLLEMSGGLGDGPAVVLGCSTGRTPLALADRHPGLVLGVDVNFSMLRIASRVLLDGEVRYPRRRVGLVYDRRSFAARFPNADRVDFWVCDALALPFDDAAFSAAIALNVLDCVAAPYQLLAELARAIRPNGDALLCTPFDWSPRATPVEAWIGGHSQRGPGGGLSEPFLRSLMGGGHPQAVPLHLHAEAEHPWHVRLHDRSTMLYKNYLAAAKVVTPPSPVWRDTELS